MLIERMVSLLMEFMGLKVTMISRAFGSGEESEFHHLWLSKTLSNITIENN